MIRIALENPTEVIVECCLQISLEQKKKVLLDY